MAVTAAIKGLLKAIGHQKSLDIGQHWCGFDELSVGDTMPDWQQDLFASSNLLCKKTA